MVSEPAEEVTLIPTRHDDPNRVPIGMTKIKPASEVNLRIICKELEAQMDMVRVVPPSICISRLTTDAAGVAEETRIPIEQSTPTPDTFVAFVGPVDPVDIPVALSQMTS
jgi:hypothetical protein